MSSWRRERSRKSCSYNKIIKVQLSSGLNSNIYCMEQNKTSSRGRLWGPAHNMI